MMISVKTLLELKGQPLVLDHSYELPQLTELNKQLLTIEPVHFVGQGQMQSGIFEVKGNLSGKYTLACSRCLSELTLSFTQELEEYFNIQSKLSSADESEEVDIHEVVGNEIDLLPFIENEVLISVPFFPACETAEECKNNLPQQGMDWSLLTEENKQEKIDPRLADLAKFFDQNKK